MNNAYNVGVYIRLSREDDDKVYESESITNQKSLLLQYAKENNLRIYDIYIDDGYSGTNFDRPEFKRLINDIELKKINMVITKDMSRLGRDYIGTGELVEKYFPEHNVRYIAVTDNIDTYLDSTNNDIAPFKAIMNDFYAKDISKKIKSSLRAKMKDGKFVGGRAPFGYDRDPDNKNHLIVNDEQALIVKRIFEMSLSGLSFYRIAEILTNEHVKTPASYYEFEWCGHNYHYNRWHAKTINDILINRMYTGDLIQNRRNKVNYKVKKIVRNNPNNYIIVENTHEAIIDKKTFEEVQQKLPKNVGRKEKKENHLLDGLLYCGDCGHRISVQARRKKDNKCYTMCNYYRTYMKDHLCTTHSNNYDILEKIILDNLKELCLKYIDKNIIKESVINSCRDLNNNDNKKEIEIISKEINQINDNLDNIYIDKLNKVINEEQFNRIKSKLELELNRKTKRLDDLKSVMADNSNKKNNLRKIEKYIESFLSMENPSRELITNLIDRIDIYEDKRINISVSFANIEK
ncbi:MAG: recombinase family protein [Bacilli bacterium]|nr:recombinase family protein [Bacilli bacterium]